MRRSVRFYKDVLDMEVLFGGEEAFFSSLRAKVAEYPILNLEQGRSVTGWGRMIFYVSDVDAFWEYLRGKGFNPCRLLHDVLCGLALRHKVAVHSYISTADCFCHIDLL
jgi:catechol 2,3-dioxygenase-like lactoylglutathione lyase family enzyme